MMAIQHERRQVVAYVEIPLKEAIDELKSSNRRLSASILIEEALVIALPTLRERYLLKSPTQGAPGRKKSAA